LLILGFFVSIGCHFERRNLQMSSSNLIRWSGLAAVVGAVLLIVLDVAEFILISGQPESAVAGTSALIIVRVFYMVSLTLMLLGLVGLYARQVEQSGSLGLIAFLVAIFGIVMTAGAQWGAAFLGPWLAEVAPAILDAEPTGLFVAGFILTFLLFALGWLLFGLASLQAKVLPRGASILMIVGAALFFVMLFLELPGSTVVFGVALAWLGYALWSGAGETAAEPQPAT
jgi:hypothetical protein